MGIIDTEFETLYALMLEDYSCPRYLNTVKAYVGTMDEIKAFVNRLEKMEGMGRRYRALIDGIRNYSEKKPVRHVVAGAEVSMLVPVEEVYRREFTLADHKWTYEAYDGSLYPACADEVWVSQIIVKFWESYLRLSKALFCNLKVFYKGSGWTPVGEEMKGFPAMVYKEGNVHSLSLHANEDVRYALSEKDVAIREIGGWLDYDMSYVMRDIIGEG